jgi:hypothetical protein
MCNCLSGNLEIPGSLVSLAPRNDTQFVAVSCSNAISVSGAVTAGEWLASIS